MDNFEEFVDDVIMPEFSLITIFFVAITVDVLLTLTVTLGGGVGLYNYELAFKNNINMEVQLYDYQCRTCN